MRCIHDVRCPGFAGVTSVNIALTLALDVSLFDFTA